MKFKEVMTEAEGRSQAVRHNDDWEDDNGQEDVAPMGDAPYAIIWHAQYHEWYGAGDPDKGDGRYKPKGDAGSVLAKNIPSYEQAQELLTNPKIEKVAQEHGEWGKDLMLISQSTGPMIVPMSELRDHFYGYDPDMQEHGAKPEQYDHHTVIDMANKEDVNEEIDHFANAIKMINSIITEIDENYHNRMELIEGPAGLRYMFGYWRNSPHTKDRVDELKKYAAEKLHEVDSKPEHVKWNKQKPWERDYGPAPTVDEGAFDMKADQIRDAITKGLVEWERLSDKEYSSQPTLRHDISPKGWASDKLSAIVGIEEDGTVIISARDPDASNTVKKLATLGGMPGVKTRVLSNDEEMKLNQRQVSTLEGHITLPMIDTERYSERPGLEGPFRARNGRVVYYDPAEGMYYDPDTDMYISNDDWEAMNR